MVRIYYAISAERCLFKLHVSCVVHYTFSTTTLFANKKNITRLIYKLLGIKYTLDTDTLFS